MIKFSKKILPLQFKSHLVNKKIHEKIDDNLLNEFILKNYYQNKFISDKEKKPFIISDWILSIQKDLNIFDENYQYIRYKKQKK